MADKNIRLRFNDSKEIKKSLNRVANLVVNNQLDPQRASAIATLCNTILKADKQLEIEKQIEELRELFKEIEERNNHE